MWGQLPREGTLELMGLFLFSSSGDSILCATSLLSLDPGLPPCMDYNAFPLTAGT